MKKLLMLQVIIAAISTASTVSIGFDNKTEGFVYKNINGNEFYTEKSLNRFKILNLDYNTKYFDFKYNFNKDIVFIEGKKKQDNLKNDLGIYFKLGDEIRFKTGLDFNFNDDYFTNTRFNTLNLKGEFRVKNRFLIKNNLTVQNGKISENEIRSSLLTNLGNLHFKLDEKYSFEKRYKQLVAKQEEIKAEDDGHNHNVTVDEIEDSTIPPIDDIEKNTNSKYESSSFDLALAYDKRQYFKNLGIDVYFTLGYNHLSLTNKLGNIVDTKLKENGINTYFEIKKELIKGLELGLDFKYGYNHLSENIVKEDKEAISRYKLNELFIKQNTINSIEKNKLSLALKLNYDNQITENLRIYVNNKLNFDFDNTKQYINSVDYNNRKRAYEEEIKFVENRKKNLTEEDKSKGKELEEQISQLKNELENFDYKETLEQAKNKLTILDKEERYNKFLEKYGNKSYEEIDGIFKERRDKKLEVSKNFPRDFRIMEIRMKNDTLEEVKTKILDYANKNNIEYLKDNIDEYLDLFEHNTGVYSSLKTSMILATSAKQREYKSKLRVYNFKYNLAIDPNIENAYKEFEGGHNSKNSIQLGLSSNIGLDYFITDNFEFSTNVNFNLEFNKKLKEKSNWKNHLHITPSLGFKYNF